MKFNILTTEGNWTLITETRQACDQEWMEGTFALRGSRSAIGLPEIFIQKFRERQGQVRHTGAAMRKKNKTKQSFSDCIPQILLMKLARNRRQEKGEKVFQEERSSRVCQEIPQKSESTARAVRCGWRHKGETCPGRRRGSVGRALRLAGSS